MVPGSNWLLFQKRLEILNNFNQQVMMVSIIMFGPSNKCPGGALILDIIAVSKIWRLIVALKPAQWVSIDSPTWQLANLLLSPAPWLELSWTTAAIFCVCLKPISHSGQPFNYNFRICHIIHTGRIRLFPKKCLKEMSHYQNYLTEFNPIQVSRLVNQKLPSLAGGNISTKCALLTVTSKLVFNLVSVRLWKVILHTP